MVTLGKLFNVHAHMPSASKVMVVWRYRNLINLIVNLIRKYFSVLMCNVVHC